MPVEYFDIDTDDEVWLPAYMPAALLAADEVGELEPMGVASLQVERHRGYHAACLLDWHAAAWDVLSRSPVARQVT